MTARHLDLFGRRKKCSGNHDQHTSEIIAGHAVRAPAVRIDTDRLATGDRDGEQHEGDDRGDR